MEWINETLNNWSDLQGASTAASLKTGRFTESRALFSASIAQNKQFINESAADGTGYVQSGPSNIKGVGPVQLPNWTPGQQFHQQTPGSGDTPAYLGMAFNISAQTIAFDLLPSIPVYSEVVLLDYVDAVYAGGTFSKTEKPVIFTIKYKAGEIDFDALAINRTMVIGVASGNAVKVQYIQKHRTKANRLVVRFVSTGTLNATPDAFTETGSVHLDTILSTANRVLYFDAASAFDASAALTTADLALEYTSVHNDHTPVGSNGGSMDGNPMEREDAEHGTRNVIEFKTYNMAVTCKEYENIGVVTKQQARQLKQKGIEAVPAIKNTLQTVVIQSINQNVLGKMRKLGVDNAVNLLSAQGIDMNLFVGPGSTASKALTNFNLQFADSNGVNQAATFGAILNSETNSAAENKWTRQNALVSRIVAAAYMIGTVSRFGPGDFAVVGPQLAAAVKSSKALTTINIEGSISQNVKNLYYLGDASGVGVYCDPTMTWNDETVLVGRSNKNASGLDWENIQPGLVMTVFDLVSSIEIIGETTASPKVWVNSIYGLAEVGVDPSMCYLTFGASTGFGQWI